MRYKSKTMKHNVKFSIITVVYNGQGCIEKTIKSVIGQSYSNIEYIIIDGSSEDETLNICDKYKDTIDVLVSESDSGLYDAMNKGITKATGDYIIFMNCDDRFHSPDVLEMIVQQMNSKGADFLYGDSFDVHNEEDRINYKKSLPFIFRYYGMFTHHQSMFYKREIIQHHKIRFNTEYKIAADYDFTLHFLRYAKKHQYFNFAISDFMLGGISENHFKLGKKEQILIRDKQTSLLFLVNKLLFTLQMTVYFFKSKMNFLYKKLRYREHI